MVDPRRVYLSHSRLRAELSQKVLFIFYLQPGERGVPAGELWEGEGWQGSGSIATSHRGGGRRPRQQGDGSGLALLYSDDS